MDKLPVAPEIQRMRDAMSDVRRLREVSGMVIDLARYDAETEPINQQFLDDFFDLLPIQPYREYLPEGRKADSYLLQDPLDIRATTSFGLSIKKYSYDYDLYVNASIIIGERQNSQDQADITEILVAESTLYVSEKTKNTSLKNAVRSLFVLTDHWNQVRNKALEKLDKPHSANITGSLYSSEKNAFIVPFTRYDLDITRMHLTRDTGLISAKDFGRKRTPLNSRYSLKENTLGGKLHEERTLRSSDLEDFDVLRHMEYVAAAFQVGEAFDTAKAEREAKMPIHPAETTFGLPGYRQMIEQHSPTGVPPLSN